MSSQVGHSDSHFSHADFVASLLGKLEAAFGASRQHGADAHERQKLYYDGAVCHQPYAVGDLVWLNNLTEDRMKLDPHWKGPYRVLAVLDSQSEPGLTHIGSPLSREEQVVHYDRLKPYTLFIPAESSSGPPPSPPYLSSPQGVGVGFVSGGGV